MKRAFAVGLGLIAGCSLLNPLDGFAGGTDDAGSFEPDDASNVVAPDGAPDTGEPCKSARPPARPAPTVGSDGGSTTIVLAVSSFEFGDPTDPLNPNSRGYDLDRLCTCPPSCAENKTCIVSEGRSARRACVPDGKTSCDYPNGVDNSGGQFWLSISRALGPQLSIASRLKTGEDGLIIRIRNYNDMPDDDAVEVGIFDTFGVEGAQPDAGPLPPLKQDGSDRWTIDPASMIGRGRLDTFAYVRGGQLVATIATTFRIGQLVFPVSDGILTGRLVKGAGGYVLEDGVLSARLFADELLKSLEVIPSPNGNFLCGAREPTFLSLKDSICSARDLPTDPSLDGLETPCTGVSLAVAFRANAATIGRNVAAGDGVHPCGADWKPSCLD